MTHNSARARGDYFELQARDALRAAAWFVVRSAGSKGPADLVALRYRNTPLLVGCKVGGRMDPQERDDLVHAAVLAGARAVVAERRRPGWVHLDELRDGVRHHLADLQVPTRPRKPKAPADQEGAEL